MLRGRIPVCSTVATCTTGMMTVRPKTKGTPARRPVALSWQTIIIIRLLPHINIRFQRQDIPGPNCGCIDSDTHSQKAFFVRTFNQRYLLRNEASCCGRKKPRCAGSHQDNGGNQLAAASSPVQCACRKFLRMFQRPCPQVLINERRSNITTTTRHNYR